MGKQIHMKNQRQSNIELLRIVAMLMIIAHHVAVHSGFAFPAGSISFNRLWIQFIQMGGKIGVNIFVLISGYFLVRADGVKTNKVIKLWLQIFTYSIITFLVIVFVSPQSFSIRALIENALPITYYKWWFVSAYFVLYLLSPYINKLLNSLDKKSYQRLLVLLFFCWCIIPTLLDEKWQSNELLWFVFLYVLAGYIRLYMDIDSIKSGKCIVTAIAVALVTFLSVVIFDLFELKSVFAAENITIFYDMQKLPILIISVMLFVGFIGLKMRHVPLINVISSACFGIYLLHDNNLLRGFIWGTVFQNASRQQSSLLAPYTLVQIGMVFLVGASVELIRIHLIERIYAKPIDRLSTWVDDKKEKIFSHKFFNKF